MVRISLTILLYFPSFLYADTTKVILLSEKISLSYSQEVRLSQVLSDASLHIKHPIYPLGSALIAPDKQLLIDKKLATVLNQLTTLNTPESSNIYNQLSRLNFVYREPVEMNISKVRVTPNKDPMIRGNYWLYLPKRPSNILILDSQQEHSLAIPMYAGANLKQYLQTLPESSHYNSVWVIQADQHKYQANNIQWKNILYFLSPGAIIFTGLDNLPKQYSNLNTDIVDLLTYQLEL